MFYFIKNLLVQSASSKKEPWEKKDAITKTIVAILTLLVAVGVFLLGQGILHPNQPTTNQDVKSGSDNTFKISSIGNTQNISNSGNTQIDDHSKQSPKVNGSSNVTINSQPNEGNFSNGSGKQINGGNDYSTTWNNTYNITQPATPPATIVTQIVLPQSPTPLETKSTSNWPGFGQDWQINFTPDLPKTGGRLYVEFSASVVQGDRLHFHLTAVNGADMHANIIVRLDGSNSTFEQMVGRRGAIDWTMKKGIPGTRVNVQIISFQPGEIILRVEKVN